MNVEIALTHSACITGLRDPSTRGTSRQRPPSHHSAQSAAGAPFDALGRPPSQLFEEKPPTAGRGNHSAPASEAASSVLPLPTTAESVRPPSVTVDPDELEAPVREATSLFIHLVEVGSPPLVPPLDWPFAVVLGRW